MVKYPKSMHGSCLSSTPSVLSIGEHDLQRQEDQTDVQKNRVT